MKGKTKWNEELGEWIVWHYSQSSPFYPNLIVLLVLCFLVSYCKTFIPWFNKSPHGLAKGFFLLNIAADKTAQHPNKLTGRILLYYLVDSIDHFRLCIPVQVYSAVTDWYILTRKDQLRSAPGDLPWFVRLSNTCRWCNPVGILGEGDLLRWQGVTRSCMREA